jgi:predicted MPP superfamily phosphohydrolase
MKIRVLSDLHVEFAPFDPPKVEADVIVLAGDIHNRLNGLNWLLGAFDEKTPIIYVLGNHEFYGDKIPELTEDLKQLTAKTNVHVLENDAVTICDVVFLGATLWSDFGLEGDPFIGATAAKTGMTDYRRIRTLPGYGKLRPADTRRYHEQSKAWLAEEVEKHRGKKVVIVTHHAPSGKSIEERFRGDPLNGAFASNMERFVEECGAKLWVHGHIHFRSDYMIGETRVLANPRGYPDEFVKAFDPGLVVEV